MSNADINPGGNPEDLFIYVAGSLSITGQNNVNGIIYVAGSVNVAGNAEITGAIGAGGALTIGGNSDVIIDPDAITNADLLDMCDGGSNPSPQCFSDDFNAGSLSDLWVTSTSKWKFSASSSEWNRLRFTQAVQDQSTSSTYQRLFLLRII